MDFSELAAAWNPEVFTETFSSWVSNLAINTVVVMIMAIFMVVGAIDRICGNKHGYGTEWENGINAMGGLAMAMAGVVAVAPLLAMVLKPIIGPIYGLVGADPAMFATTLLACDMGGYPLALQLAETAEVGQYAGIILGSMMGPTIVFTIPVALGIINPLDRPFLGAGTLVGMVTIPIGCVVGGLVMNTTPYKIGIGTILVNVIPVIIIAGLIAVGLWFAPAKMISGFNAFGNGVTIFITAVTAIAIFEYNTGIRFPLFDTMVDYDGGSPLESGLLVCGQIAITLAGAYPMVKFVSDTFGKALAKVGTALGMNAAGATGMVANLANNIAMFNILSEMNPQGKLLNCAFAVSAAFVFGDHLGFTGANSPEMIFPMIAGKLTAGITALILGKWMAPALLKKIPEESMNQ